MVIATMKVRPTVCRVMEETAAGIYCWDGRVG
jgi:hypothetical protein